MRLREGTSALSLVPRPEWPPLQSVDSRRDDQGWLTVLTFGGRVPVPAVVAELGRQSVWPDRVGGRGLVVHTFGGPDRDKVPADVSIADWHMTFDDEGEPPVTGRPPLMLTTARGAVRAGRRTGPQPGRVRGGRFPGAEHRRARCLPGRAAGDARRTAVGGFRP